MPPGSAKSTYGSVRFPAYYVGRFPKKGIICASYGDSLAKAFGRKVRNLIGTREYTRIFNLTLAEDSQAKGEWETHEGGTYFACGVGTAITGRRADLGLIDDPVKGRKEADSDTVKESTWEWYKSDFLTRLKPGAAQIIIQTRWVDDDLSGRILPAEWNGESGQFVGFDGELWTVICLQAEAEEGKNDPLGRNKGEYLWTEWFTADYWRQTKAAQAGSDIRNWSALYQQCPTPDEGSYFQRDDIRWYEWGDPPKHLRLYGASDYAVTEDGGDWTVHGVAGLDPNHDFYIRDWWRGQTSPDVWIETQCDLIHVHKPLIWVGESGPIRRSVEPFLVRRMKERKDYCRLDWLPSITDKPTRARAIQARASMHKLYLPLNAPPDIQDRISELVRQMLRFPNGAVDDDVDVLSLFGRMLDVFISAHQPAEKPKKPTKVLQDMTLNDLFAATDNTKKRI